MTYIPVIGLDEKKNDQADQHTKNDNPLFHVLFFGILQQIPWLTVQHFANGFQGTEPNSFCFAGFEYGQVGER